jgi:hypothetical protein
MCDPNQKRGGEIALNASLSRPCLWRRETLTRNSDKPSCQISGEEILGLLTDTGVIAFDGTVATKLGVLVTAARKAA